MEIFIHCSCNCTKCYNVSLVFTAMVVYLWQLQVTHYSTTNTTKDSKWSTNCKAPWLQRFTLPCSAYTAENCPSPIPNKTFRSRYTLMRCRKCCDPCAFPAPHLNCTALVQRVSVQAKQPPPPTEGANAGAFSGTGLHGTKWPCKPVAVRFQNCCMHSFGAMRFDFSPIKINWLSASNTPPFLWVTTFTPPLHLWRSKVASLGQQHCQSFECWME